MWVHLSLIKLQENSCSMLKIRVKHTKCHAFGGDNNFIIHKSFGLISTPQKSAHVNQLKHSVIYIIKIYDFEWGTRIKNKNYVHVYQIARFSSQFRILFCSKESKRLMENSERQKYDGPAKHSQTQTSCSFSWRLKLLWN